MNKTNVTVPSTKGMSTLVRAKFGPGMLLQHEDLEQLNVYTRELSRLMFRSFFGCGVVRGLVVTPPVEECGKVKVTVGAGLALNCLGDPVYVPEPKDLTFSIDEHCDSTIKMSLWVVLCGATKNCRAAQFDVHRRRRHGDLGLYPRAGHIRDPGSERAPDMRVRLRRAERTAKSRKGQRSLPVRRSDAGLPRRPLCRTVRVLLRRRLQLRLSVHPPCAVD